MKKHSVLYNFIMNFILTISSFIFPLITFPYVSRILLPSGIGKVSFATSVVNYFVLIAQLGIPLYGVKACARVKYNKEYLGKTVQEILCINLIMSVISYILFLILLFKVPRLWQERQLMIVISMLIIFTTLGVEWFFRALEMYSYITWQSIIFKFIALLSMFLLVHSQEDYIVYGGISIFAASASGILNFVYLHKIIDFNRRYKLELRRHIKPILILFAMSCATTVYSNLDIVMLGFMKTDADMGYYNAAIKVKNMLGSLVISLGTVLLPRVTLYLEMNEKEKFRSLSINAIRFVLFSAIPMLIFFIIYAKSSILLLSGDGYENAILPMQILMPTLLFLGLTNIMGVQIMIPMGKESKVLVSVCIGAIMDLIINILLIPEFSVSGAAIGTLVAEVTVFIYQYFACRELFHSLFREVRPCKIIISAIVAVFMSVWTLKVSMNLLILFIISCICYGGSYIICLLVFQENFILELFKMIRKKP